MKNIRIKLLSVFMLVIAVMLAVSAVLFWMHLNAMREDEQITNNMFLEYRLIDATNRLTQVQYQLIKSYSKDLLQEYQQLNNEIESIFSYLDTAITYNESKVMYRGVKNVIRNIIADCNSSIENARKGNVFESLQAYAEVSRKNYYVKDNFASLILAELKYANLLQDRFKEAHSLFMVSSVILLLCVGMVCIVFAFIFSKRFTRPLERLSDVAKRIARGDVFTRVDEELLKEKNEIGVLADSFNNMVISLESSIAKLSESNRQLKQTQAQLVQSAKMASIGLLAGGVAHEINNPLTGVLNNVQLIKMIVAQQKEFHVEDFKSMLEIIEECATRCKTITQSLLNFSTTSKGLTRPLSLNEIVNEVLVLIERELGLQNIVIHKNLQADLPCILGDHQLLQQVIFDLIYNARWAIQKKTDKSGEVTIKTTSDQENKQVIISVSDTGIGISKENQEKIFEPFFTTKAVGEGTGLGLSIVYSIVNAHKGTIEVESEPGIGTTFKIIFPAASPSS